jgi:hypothetical protein
VGHARAGDPDRDHRRPGHGPRELTHRLAFRTHRAAQRGPLPVVQRRSDVTPAATAVPGEDPVGRARVLKDEPSAPCAHLRIAMT